MTISYSGNPSTSTVDALRLLTGDTNCTQALLHDEELAYLLTTYTTVAAAVPEVLRAMLLRCAMDTLVSADGITRDLTERRVALERRLADVTQQAQFRSVVPFVGGISVSERDTRREATDLVQPAFQREQHESLEEA